MFDQLWDRQTALIDQFEEIERKNKQLICSHGQIMDLSLDNPFAQQRLKEMAWRVVEEITEATDAEEDPIQYNKELMDVYSFLLELLILSKVNPDLLFPNYTHSLQEIYDTIEEETLTERELAYDLVEAIGMAMNHLKNKPWKVNQTNVVDVSAFHYYLELAHFSFIRWVAKVGINAHDLVSYFIKTADNNQKRINDNV